MDAALLRDLEAEQEVLDALVAGLGTGDWARPTPAEGWTVADSIEHLAVSELVARASVADDRDPLDGGEPVVVPREPSALLACWRDARGATLAAFAAKDDADRVPWGGRRMTTRSLATARLMECWAHGLDCFAAADVAPVDTDRLEHVAWLGWKTLPYAFAVASETPPVPPDRLRLELRAPGGGTWRIGPDDPEGVVRGPAGDWCRIATHRLRAPAHSRLECDGELAEAAVRVARAFL